MFISACAETNQRRVSACAAARFRLTPKDIAHLTALPSSRKTPTQCVLRERGGARERTEIFSAEKTESSALCADDDAWVLWHGDNARFGSHDFALMQRSLLPVFGSEQAQQGVHRAPGKRQQRALDGKEETPHSGRCLSASAGSEQAKQVATRRMGVANTNALSVLKDHYSPTSVTFGDSFS